METSRKSRNCTSKSSASVSAPRRVLRTDGSSAGFKLFGVVSFTSASNRFVDSPMETEPAGEGCKFAMLDAACDATSRTLRRGRRRRLLLVGRPCAAAGASGATAQIRIVSLELHDLRAPVELDSAAVAQKRFQLRASALHARLHPRHRKTEVYRRLRLGAVAKVGQKDCFAIRRGQLLHHRREARRDLAAKLVCLVANLELRRVPKSVAQLRSEQQ